MFTIPNQIDAGFSDQSEPDSRDFDIIAAAFGGSGVTSGCVVSAQGSPNMTVAVAAGGAMVGGVKVNVTAGNVTISTADGTNPRFDLIVVDNTGALSAVAGTAGSNPVLPGIPGNRTVLAAVYVPTGDTTINANQITDKRIQLALPVVVRKTADEIVNASTAFQNDDHLALTVAASEVWTVELRLLLNAASATPDFKFQFTAPAAATFTWGVSAGDANGWHGDGIGSAGTALLTLASTRPEPCPIGTKGVKLTGIYVGGANAGTLQLQWAQNTSNASDSKLLANSCLIANKLG